MDSSGSVLLKGERFHDHKMAWLWFLDVHKFVNVAFDLEEIWVCVLADFTFKLLPVHADQAVCFFLLHFSGKPVLEAVVVNKANRSWTLARHNARIVWSWLVWPAESALTLLRLLSIQGYDLLSLLELLFVQFLLTLSHILALEILYSELNSAQLDNIELSYFVILTSK